MNTVPIGVMDSGYGGLTVLQAIQQVLPQYDYIYLGDNARTPYGTRSYHTVYEYTWQCVQQLLAMQCPLVILACNTASAKALRTIQQVNLPQLASPPKVLGVIRPTAEVIGTYTSTQCVGILATNGTVASESYVLEITKLHPHIQVYQQACPMLVPLIEHNEHNTPPAEYFIMQYVDALLQQNNAIDTIVLACTHYPLLYHTIRAILPVHIKVVSQGSIVAHSLATYLTKHTALQQQLTQDGTTQYYTTDSVDDFNAKATLFLHKEIAAQNITLP